MKHTINCVRCYRKATRWTGYVETRTKVASNPNKIDMVLAGWCTGCFKKRVIFHGHHNKKMGLEKGRSPEGGTIE